MNKANPLHAGTRIERTPQPCTVVIFGATGDLTARKLVPALYNLGCEGLLPGGFSLVGFGRRPWSDADFAAEMRKAVDEHSRSKPINEDLWQSFAEGIFFVQGDFADAEPYTTLSSKLEEIAASRGTGGNRLFYLATPPSFFDDIVSQLKQAGLNRKGATGQEPGEHWTRIIIEKPFGHDLATARQLNAMIDAAFDEGQIYRIDHYLGKETVQNLLVMRFANTIFEPIWTREYIDHVQITVAESLGIGGRAGYYEESGALRDMVTNHMMQLLTLTAMEPPVHFDAESVRGEKVKVLHAIRPWTPDEVDANAVRGQYTAGAINGEDVPGYKEEQGVAPTSITPTFVALKFQIESWRWAGVPFYLRTGKRLAKRVTEVAIQFKLPPLLLFPEIRDDIQPNILALRIQPNEGISLKFSAKQPGQRMTIHPVNMDFRYGSSFGIAAPEAYERLLLDAMLGDPTLFTRRDEVEAQWELMNPILERWTSQPDQALPGYEAGTWGPAAADEFITSDHERTWRKL